MAAKAIPARNAIPRAAPFPNGITPSFQVNEAQPNQKKRGVL
jgi:hypothetical protein